MDRDSRRPANMRLTGTEQHEHDALAELFLGDAPLAPAPMGEPKEPSEVPANAGPSIESRVATFEGSAVRSVAEASESGEADLNANPLIELVVLGHLPVRASLWVRQYACLAARKRSETVALVRSAGDSVAVDVITGHQRAEIAPVESIVDAMTIAKSASSRVVVRVDETTEPELLERGGIDEVTILTGADEAAVVASYRLIKSLVSTFDDRLEPDAMPALRVAVMGGSGDDIRQACLKIERACRAFLDRPIEILDASGRIDATGTASICRTDAEGSSAVAIEALLGTTSVQAPIDTDMTGVALGLRLADDLDSDDTNELDSALLADAEQAELDEVPEIVVRPIARAVAAESIVEPDTRRIRHMRDPLPLLIEGLTPIEARCPSAVGVEFACDQDGQLHAVVTDDVDNAVAKLIAAGAWAMDHLPLLIRAESQVAMPTSEPQWDAGVSLHLLARRPAASRAMLETNVNIYALATAYIGGEPVSVATPLNL